MLTWFWRPDRERKQSQRNPQLLFVGPFFRPEFKTHHWRCSSSWDNRMPRRKSSFRTFTNCRNLLSLSANKLLFSGYQATDTGHTRLFFTLSCSHCTSATFSLFLHQRNSIMHGHCSRGERLWPLASPPGYERHKGPSCILSGASGQKKGHLKTNRTSLFLLMANLLRALFLSLKKMDFTF